MNEQNFVSPQSGTGKRVLMIALSVLALAGVGVFSLYWYQEYTRVVSTFDTSIEVFRNSSKLEERIAERAAADGESGSIISCPAPRAASDTAAPSIPVVLYTEQIATTPSTERFFPTVRLSKKAGDANPVVLTEVGKLGEYPSQFVLSPDKTKLVINLESKLEIFDLTTRQSHHLFFSQRTITALGFSPDGEKLFIAMEDPISETDGKVYFHTYQLSDCTDTVVYQEERYNGTFFDVVWRKDNMVILTKQFGDAGAQSYFFSLDTRTLERTADVAGVTSISDSGEKIIVIKDWATDVCNEFSGMAPSGYEIIEPVSNKVLGILKSENNYVGGFIFSPAEDEVLYIVEKPWEYKEDCMKERTKTYYTANITTGISTKVTDLPKLLSTWKVNYIGARLGYGEGGASVIYVNDKPIITSTSSVQIVAQYYE